MVMLQPFGDRIAVKVLYLEQNLGGLIIPVAKDKSNRGVVIAVGDGEGVQKIKINDIVIFNLGSGLSYSDSDGDYRVLDLRDIIGKVIGE